MIRSCVREWILGRGRVPVMHQLGRWVYFAYLKLFVWAWRWRGASAVYLRRGVAWGDFLPGASDLDVAVSFQFRDFNQEKALVAFAQLWRRYSPLPIDLALFEERELKRYVEEGPARGCFAPFHWVPLWGPNLGPSELTPEEVRSLCFEESLFHLQQVQGLALSPAPLSRHRVRHLLKSAGEALLLVQGARSGRVPLPTDRVELLCRQMQDELAWRAVAERFSDPGPDTRWGVWVRVLRAVSNFAESWTVPEGGVEEVRREVGGPRPLWWNAEGDRLRPLVLAEARLHHRLYLCVEGPWDAVVERLRGFGGRALASLGLPEKDWLVVTPELLSVLPRTLFYQQEAFYRPGFRWSRDSPLGWSELRSHRDAWLEGLLKRKACEGAGLARAQWGDGEAGRWWREFYRPLLEGAQAHVPQGRW